MSLRFIYCFCIVGLSMISCQERMSVRFELKNGHPFREAVVETPDTTLHIRLDSAGYADYTVELDANHRGYGKLTYGRFGRVFLFFYRDFTCRVDLRNLLNLSSDFSGEGALLNRHVGFYERMSDSCYAWKEKEFLQEIDKRYNFRLNRLDSIDFPREYRKIEEYRLRLSYAYPLYSYFRKAIGKEGDSVRLTDEFYSYWKHFWIDDSLVLSNTQAKGYLLEAVREFAEIECSPNKDERAITEKAVNTVLDCFTDPALKSYLVQHLVISYADRYSVQNLGNMKNIFDNVVTDVQAKSKLAELYEQAARIMPGSPSPGFVYEDVNGNTVSLESLKGNYVYIDIWATWCSPCRREIPHLERLEKHFAGKNIHFVSISTDKDREAWKKMVKENKMGGIQLNTNGDMEFSKAYRIRTIPRFILLDPQGCIINAEMSRPSDPATLQFLKGLEGI